MPSSADFLTRYEKRTVVIFCVAGRSVLLGLVSRQPLRQAGIGTANHERNCQRSREPSVPA